MRTRELSNDLSSLSDSFRTTFQLISRLSKLSFAPGSVPLVGDGDVRVELTQDIHESLKSHEETLDLLRQSADDLSSTGGRYARRDSGRDKEKERIVAQVARLSEDLKHARAQFRRAQLNAKRASESAKQKEREILFAELRERNINEERPTSTDLFAGRRHTAKNLTQDELLIGASSDVTAALRQTHSRLASELSRSRFVQETFEESQQALKDLGERYGTLDTLLSSSKNLLGTLVKSQKSDTWYLETAFYILVVVIGWLVFRRLIYGPAWWFIWLPLKYLLLKPFYFLFSLFGIRTAASGTPALSQSASISRRPLRVQPSASGGLPRFKDHAARMGPAVPVGGGGAGAKTPQQGASGDGGLAQKIGDMAEASREAARQGGTDPGDKEPVIRADGTKLEPRGDKPKNPRKKMFEADVEDANYEASMQRDEL